MSRSVRAAATLVLILVAFATDRTSAAAHEGPGTIVVEQSEPVGDSQIRYVVRLTFINDGDPAADATVTATAIAADGTAQTPVPMVPSDSDGRYEAAVAFPAPGDWTVRFTAVTPPATLEQPATIAAPPTTTVTTTATTTPSTASPTSVSATSVTSNSSDGGSGTSGAPVAIALVAGIAAAVGVWWFVRGRRRTTGVS